MKGEDRNMRGKELVAYFIPKHAASYSCLGSLGHSYKFTKKNPAKVTMLSDIQMFRARIDVQECDSTGCPLAEGAIQNVPLSYSTTDKPDLSSSEKMVLVGDKISVASEDAEIDPSEEKKEEKEEEKEEEEEEKPKKKKKKKKKKKEEEKEKPKKPKKKKEKEEKKKKKPKKKKKKESEEEFEEDWDEDD